MKLKLITTTLAIILGTSGVTYARSLQPEKCPDGSALQVTHFDEVNRSNYWYATVYSNNFDTNDKWGLLVRIMNADDENDATTKALEIVKILMLEQGPVELPEDGYWGCHYMDREGNRAVTVTLPMWDSKRASLTK